MKGEWLVHEEKLLCLMVLDDNLTEFLSPIAGDAFWRGFILENRETHQVTARFRFKYFSHRTWYEINPTGDTTPPKDEAIKYLVENLTHALGAVVNICAPGVWKPECMVCHYPPDDGGDGGNTIAWLLEKDLVEIVSIGDGG